MRHNWPRWLTENNKMSFSIKKAERDFPGWEFFGEVYSQDGYTLMECRCQHHFYGQVIWLYCFEKNAIGLFADHFDKL
jgi:hypothetical protein